jgi:hypothetical protein
MNTLKNEFSGCNKHRYYKKIRKDGFGNYQTIPYTRAIAIKKCCLECVGFIYSEMKNCTMPECPIFPYRLGKSPEGMTPQNRAKAIRLHCMECCSDDKKYINECPAGSCALHPYRLAGYRTDTSTLIAGEDIENHSEEDNGFEDFEEKIAV